MISSSDPFSQSFDSIRLDRSVPLPSELKLENVTPAAGGLLFNAEEMTSPGFYLLDDAGGRFTIDRETGIVTLVHDHLIALEAGAIHPVHIKVIEHSGSSYDLRFRLRMTGRVPQIAGAEENDGLAHLAAAPLLDLLDTTSALAPAPVAATTTCSWTTFALSRWHSGAPQRLGSEREIYGALLEPAPISGYFGEPGALRLSESIPAPSPSTADWRIDTAA